KSGFIAVATNSQIGSDTRGGIATAAARQQQTNRNDFALCRVMARGQQRSCPGAVARSLGGGGFGKGGGRSLRWGFLLQWDDRSEVGKGAISWVGA
ncbi:MAG: hypothetical protein MH252_14195, partial [Thermosynechococcaceae cyanobacterium MS004]|nr:hypothetical protein [Thermosynechococcaceae cyanobacterium MS004]